MGGERAKRGGAQKDEVEMSITSLRAKCTTQASSRPTALDSEDTTQKPRLQMWLSAYHAQGVVPNPEH